MYSVAKWTTMIVLAVATFTDLRSRRIPNWLVLPYLLTGIAASGWFRSWHGIGQSLAGMGLGLLIYGVLFWMGGMGAGDVKLCAAIGAWIWPQQLLFALVVTAMAGGVMILCWAIWRAFLKSILIGASDLVLGRKKTGMRAEPDSAASAFLKKKIPYAPAMAIGTLISFYAIPR